VALGLNFFFFGLLCGCGFFEFRLAFFGFF
jgi:hypothetical protein